MRATEVYFWLDYPSSYYHKRKENTIDLANTWKKVSASPVLSKNQCFAGLFLLTKTIKNVVTLN